MRNLFLSILLAAGTTACAADEGTLRISGTLTGLGDSIAVVQFNQMSGSRKTVNSKFKTLGNGRFDVTIPLTEVSTVYVYDPVNKQRMLRPGDMSMPAIPGEEVVMTGSMDSYKLSGTAFYQQYEKTREMRKPFDDRFAAMAEEYMKMQKSGVSKDSLNEFYVSQSNTIRDEQAKAALEYIGQHPGEEPSVFLALSLNDESAEKAIALLSDKVKTGRLSQYLAGAAKQRQVRQERKQNSEKLKEGAPAPDFTLGDINGKRFTLSSLRGKYVVLDFWGSWCGWCIKGMPKMKEYYEKYKGKFEIVGVDCRDTEEKWHAAVKTHALPWLHVRNIETEKPDVSVLYGVSGYPTKILISPEGNIAKVIIGESPEFYEFLDSKFK